MVKAPMTRTLITGASSGIGRTLSIRLARDRHALALVARRESELQEVAGLCRDAGAPDVRIYPTDVSDPAAAQRTVQQAEAALGGLDLVIANAGIAINASVHKMSWEDFERLTRVNYLGAVATFLAALPGMVERKSGHLVGVASIAGFRGLPKFSAYSASKAALIAFLEGARVDLRSRGVDVTIVSPGYVATPMTAPNRFKMPFLVDVDRAADLIATGIASKRRHIAFPFPMVTAMRLARTLPMWLYDRVVGQGTKKFPS